MKRTLILCLVLALMIAVIIPAVAFAAGSRGNFTDADNDGFCDYAVNDCNTFADEDNDGVCDNFGGCGRGNGRRCGGMGNPGCPRWNNR